MKFDDVPTAMAQLDDEAVEQFLFDCVERRFGRSKLNDSDYTFNRELPAGYLILIPTVWIEGEVSNGGIEQYFWNRLVDYEPMTADAIKAYEKIGAEAQAKAVRECLRAFAPLESTCRKLRQARNLENDIEYFHKWNEVWSALHFRGDNPLFEYEAVTKLYRVPWIRRNPMAFVFPDDLVTKAKRGRKKGHQEP